MKAPFLFVLICCIMFGCKSSKTLIDDAHPIHALISSKNFEFSAKSASPMATQSLTAIANSGLLPPGNSVSRIDLNGNGYFLKVFNDSVSANLPYYGERQFGGTYGIADGVKFNGVPSDYEQIFSEDKQKYIINFQISNKTDRYTITMHIFPNKSCLVNVNTTNRNTIQYNGNVESLHSENID
ncbi:MAG: DUF4251 domain-containing protein [Maribacter dokdonensis]|uniref:DUF4251 domain-containing protein n=1 Tax=Maribacter dokdonensis TaxID=320912 RepID=UPI003298C8ED